VALVEAGRFSDPFAARLARDHLASGGIDSFLFDEGIAGLGVGILLPVRLMVLAEDRETASTLLAELPKN
jgi:hypothetical protein